VLSTCELREHDVHRGLRGACLGDGEARMQAGARLLCVDQVATVPPNVVLASYDRVPVLNDTPVHTNVEVRTGGLIYSIAYGF
jgi:hypothetical protein